MRGELIRLGVLEAAGAETRWRRATGPDVMEHHRLALAGGTLLGLAGVIMVIPVAATVKVVVSPLLADRAESPPEEEAPAPPRIGEQSSEA